MEREGGGEVDTRGDPHGPWMEAFHGQRRRRRRGSVRGDAWGLFGNKGWNEKVESKSFLWVCLCGFDVKAGVVEDAGPRRRRQADESSKSLHGTFTCNPCVYMQ
eukprot:scaffold456_cov368-Pavlova_lutheri.AAC.35